MAKRMDGVCPTSQNHGHLPLYLSCSHYGYSLLQLAYIVFSITFTWDDGDFHNSRASSCLAQQHSCSISVWSVWCSLALSLSGYSFFFLILWLVATTRRICMVSPLLFFDRLVDPSSMHQVMKTRELAISPASQRDVANTSCRFWLLLSCGCGWNGRPVTDLARSTSFI
jgi:hypothetical protein